jgi:uncharacterized protein (DUF2236 family)
VPNPPRTRAEVDERLREFRPELQGTPAAREAARFLLVRPPLPLPLRAPYAVLATTAVGMLPRWARLPLCLPYLPVAESTAIPLAGHGLIAGLRWATTATAAE